MAYTFLESALSLRSLSAFSAASPIPVFLMSYSMYVDANVNIDMNIKGSHSFLYVYRV